MISFSASFNEIPTGILITDISFLSGTTFPGRWSTEIVFFFAKHDCPFDDIFQFSHISRPVISAQRLHCLRVKPFISFLYFFVYLMTKKFERMGISSLLSLNGGK